MRNDSPESRLHRLIVEHATEATLVVDDDGRVVLANRAARSFPGVDLEKLFRWSPGRDAELVSFRAQLRVGSRASCELCVRDAGSEPRWLWLEGRAHGPLYVVTVGDLTARRAEDEELRHLRRLEAMGYLTASVVHDFNNVLTAMVCSAAVLARALPSDEPAASLARNIVNAGERGAGLVRRLLRGLRREPTRPERVNLSTVIAEARSLVELLVGKSVEVKVELDPALGDTIVDREQLDQVVLNLAANARDAMPGGGTLTIHTASVQGGDPGPASGCDPEAAYVALVVTDTGRGMNPAERERVFERFFTTKESGEGTGLGLATAHRFVKASGGCISVRSAPGQGTSVLVYLPRAATQGKVIPMSPPPADAPRGKETLVVVEPDDHVRFVVRTFLSERGYRVIDAPTGELALRQVALAEVRVDLVLADVGSSGLRGEDVAYALGRDGQPARLLLMSGMSDHELEQHGATSAPLLRKAFTPSELARRVREELERQGQARSGEIAYDENGSPAWRPRREA